MWGRLVEQVRRAGWRKVTIFAIAAGIAIALAYGNNSTNDAANGQTLPHVSHVSHAARLSAPAAAAAHRP